MQSNTVQRGKHEASRKRGLGAVSWILIAVCVCIAGLSGYKLISKFISYRESKAHYADISEVALEPSGYNSGTKESGESSNPIPQRLINPIPEVDFAALKSMDKNAYGYLYIPDTTMNYPVAKTDSNDFYLDHQFGGKYNQFGCPFVETHNNDGLVDLTTIIYGHHLRNKEQFYMLDYYAEQEYYDKHPVVYFTGPGGVKYRLYIFAAFNCDAYSDTYTVYNEYGQPTFSYSKDVLYSYADWIAKMKSQSKIKTDVEVTDQDQVMVLSTCAYSYKTERMVVLAKVVKSQNGTWYDDEE